MNSRDTLEAQTKAAKDHFDVMLAKTQLQMNEKGYNVVKYWENDSVEDTLSFVPTSAHSGEGMCDLMCNLINMG